MKNLLFALLLLGFPFMLSAQTERTIHVATAGSLRDIIPIDEKHQIDKLTLTGELNGTDFNYIREMTGDSVYLFDYRKPLHFTTNGKLRKLDISDAQIVDGGGDCIFIYINSEHEYLGFPTIANTIYQKQFSGYSLEEIILPNSVTSIGNRAFEGCSGLTSMKIPVSVTSISGGAFNGCSGLTSIIVEESNTVYDSRDNCNAIIETATKKLISGCQNTTIPNSVTSIGVDAFGDCDGLSSITVEGGNTVYDSRENCNAIIETASNTLIAGCQNTTIPNSVTSIGDEAFHGSHLTSITIPNSVTSIGYRAFRGCSCLTDVYCIAETIPETEGDAFGYQVKEINVTLHVPAGSISAYRNTEPWCYFKEIVALSNERTDETYQTERTIHVATAGTLSSYISKEEKYQIEELTLTGEINGDDLGFIRQMAGKERKGGSTLFMLRNTEGKLASLDISKAKIVTGGISIVTDDGDNEFQYTVTRDNEIPPYIFSGCKNLVDISISNDVNSIGTDAFWGTAWYDNQPEGLVYIGKMLYDYKGEMPANTSIKIEKGTIGIACSAFVNCNNLVSIEIPNSVTSIGGMRTARYGSLNYGPFSYGAFHGCTGLTSIIIPNSVTYIGAETFEGCSGLMDVYCISETIPETSNYAFGYQGEYISNAILHVPAGSISAYSNTEPWSYFKKIVALSNESTDEPQGDGYHFFVVKAKDGTNATFALADEPKITNNNGELTIQGSNSTFKIRLSDVQSFKFLKQTTGINSIIKDEDVRVTNDCVVFDSLSAGSKVSVYMADGTLVKNFVADGNGSLVIGLSELPKGILVLHSARTNIKVINK